MNKTALSEDLVKLKQIFSKSVYIKRECKAGMVITEDDIALKKPAEGVDSSEYESVLGKTLKIDKEKDSPLYWEDLV